jgi:hypothetical protein
VRAPIVTLLIVALLATGCTPSANTPAYPPQADPFTAPVVSLNAPVKSLIGLTSPIPAGTSGSEPVYPLLAFPQIDTNYGKLGIVYWGTRDPANGNIADVTQAQVLGINGTQSQHLWFVNDRPVVIRDDASGYSIVTVAQKDSRTLVTFCDPDKHAIAHVTILSYGIAPNLGPVSDGGSCQISVGALRRVARTRSPGWPLLRQVSSLQARIDDSAHYVAIVSLAMEATIKFKSHKDNPTQVTIGPTIFMLIAAALTLLPAIGKTINVSQMANPPLIDGIPPAYANLEP